ncbi:Glucan endo-1 3-beta-glucosidase 13 [Bienertia sinuspersici]
MAVFQNFFLLLFFITIFTFISSIASTPTIGVTINHHPPSTTPQLLATTINRHKITAVRLVDPNPNLIRSFSYSSISLHLTIPNSLIPSLAANRSNAALWVYTHVVPFYPRANITAISVGSDVISSSLDLADVILPAIRNVHVALHELGIRKISVSTTFSAIPLLSSVFPPSSAEFLEPANDLLIRPLLDFLQEANSAFFVNLYPYDLYRLNHDTVLGFALFQEGPFSFRDDYTTGVRYQNLFDVMVDAVLSAIALAGHENIPVVVTGTGWPSSPGNSPGEESDANLVYAEMYLRGLIGHLKSGECSPLKKDAVSEAYIFELFDRERNQGNTSEPMRQWGILYPNMTSKYNLDFNGCSRFDGGRGFFLLISLIVLAFL